MTRTSLLRSSLASLVAFASGCMLLACSKELPPPPYEANPDAKDVWDVVVTLHDAPTDMTVDAAYINYEITDVSCLPPINNYAGIRREPHSHSLKIELNRVDATRYTGTYFADGMLKKDYYGFGICDWSAAYVSASLSTEQTKSYTYFTVFTHPEERSTTRYADKFIPPPFHFEGFRYVANSFSKERYLNLTDERRNAMFSYTLSTSSRDDSK